jgi:hypothetical protein
LFDEYDKGSWRLINSSIEQVETLLKTQDPPTTTADPASAFTSSTSGIGLRSVPATDFDVQNILNGVNDERWRFQGESPQPPQPPLDDLGFNSGDLNMNIGLDDNTFTWEMIGLGLEEPLPPQETIDEL